MCVRVCLSQLSSRLKEEKLVWWVDGDPSLGPNRALCNARRTCPARLLHAPLADSGSMLNGLRTVDVIKDTAAKGSKPALHHTMCLGSTRATLLPSHTPCPVKKPHLHAVPAAINTTSLHPSHTLHQPNTQTHALTTAAATGLIPPHSHRSVTHSLE